MAAPIKQQDQLCSKIVAFAIFTRISLIVIQVVFNAIIPDHDSGAFNPPEEKSNLGLMQNLTAIIVGGFRRWDGVYLTHVAEYGYTYENTLAFFPIYPLLVRILSNSFLLPLKVVFSYGIVILLSGVMVNFFLFVQSAKCVFRLGQSITKNDSIAYKAALLYCVNPASIFMTAPYSEVLFNYLSLLGMIKLESGKKFSATVCFGLSCATRSNGLLNLGYLMYHFFHDLHSGVRRIRRGVVTVFSTVWVLVVLNVLPYCVYIGISLAPFALYQYYCYILYCSQGYTFDIPDHIRDYGRARGLILLGDEPSAWCQDTLPVAYSYIQKHYWDQGLLHYWELKQIPNFLLAVPVTVLVLYTAATFFKHNRSTCLTLGLAEPEYIAKKKELPDKALYRLEGAAALPYVIHALAFTVFAWGFIHIQVLTRLLFSANPVLLWSAAHLTSRNTPVQPQSNRYTLNPPQCPPVETAQNMDKPWTNLLTNQIAAYKSQDFTTKLVIGYFLGYFMIGTMLFCNYLPWT